MSRVEVVREPLYRTAPDCRDTFGDLAARVGRDLGLPPDPEQQTILDAIFAERAPAVPRYRHVAIVGPRQNIKTSTKIVAALTDLFVLGVPEAIWTAHQSKTSTKSYEDMKARILGHPDYASLTDFKSGRGEELILLPKTSASLEFRARSGGSGRGFTTDRLTLDEALYLTAADLGALLPTMLTRKGAQVRYGSSAGMRKSEALRDIRERGRNNRDDRLFYVEYGSEPRDCEQEACSHAYGLVEGCALDDRDLWWQSCSALWCGRIDEDAIEDLRRSMPAEEFMREILVWWEDPPEGGGVLDLDVWAGLNTGNQVPATPVLSLEVALDRSVAHIGMAFTVGNKPHLERQPTAVADVITRLVGIRKNTGASTVACATNSEAAGFAQQLQDAGFEVVPVNGPGLVAACGSWHDLATQGGLTHNGDPAVTAAIAAARWKDVGDGARVLTRRHGDIHALYAVVLALHGLNSARQSDFFVL